MSLQEPLVALATLRLSVMMLVYLRNISENSRGGLTDNTEIISYGLKINLLQLRSDKYIMPLVVLFDVAIAAYLAIFGIFDASDEELDMLGSFNSRRHLEFGC